MKQQASKRRKKKRTSRAAGARDGNGGKQGNQESQVVLTGLMDAFDSISLEEASSGIKEAQGDAQKATEILTKFTESSEDSSSTSLVRSGFSSSESGLGSSSSSTVSSEGFVEGSLISRKGFRGGNKQKRVMAVTGTVSTVLGKGYVKASARRDAFTRNQFGGGGLGKEEEEAEQFLCSMLGDDCELSFAVVRDVLCQCGYNVDKALDVLLDLSASSISSLGLNILMLLDLVLKHRTLFYHLLTLYSFATVAKLVIECNSQSSNSEAYESINGCRNYWEDLSCSKDSFSTSQQCNESDLPQKLLESLFNIPKNSERKTSTMNWRNVVKKIQSMGPGVDVRPSSDGGLKRDKCGNGNDYDLFRRCASGHWDAMRSYYQRATEAYSRGQRQYASYFSDQGKEQNKLAREADKKASQDIFKARNKGIENVVTIDLHGQHVKPAMQLLKVHLLFGTYTNSIQTLRVITGCGGHGLGKSKLKQSVIKLLEEEDIEWKEENKGTVIIKLGGYKEFSFLGSESESE
ncbi:hypothetical protein K2173_001831 [Erythroxylum novogranatense]|uniref:Smr domain-containing protein n=1 Tax=Erythroxylum novogranatense TaxID=1862640 RepID=A0AAV8TQK6_9ROSI|nr:hypothetical protein K2173_001831 [Erythroxylum novogranatense]